MTLLPQRLYFEVRRPDGTPLHDPPHLMPIWEAAWRFAGHALRRSDEKVEDAIAALKKEGYTCQKVRVTNW